MSLQQDSIAQPSNTGATADSVAPKHTVLTPGMVIRWLPRDATPAQQDSAVQAHFKPRPIRWSKRPDTLHLPGHDRGHNMLDVRLPQYYREGFFSKDSMFHPELPGGRYGEAGDPVPYNLHGDNILTLMLLLSFIFAVISFSNVRSFILRQTHDFLYTPYNEDKDVNETSFEFFYQSFFVLLTSFLLALLYYFLTLQRFGDTFVVHSLYYLLGIFWAMSLGYYLLKATIYTIVNNIFFDSKRNGHWIKSMLFITSLEGVLLFPLVVLWAYFDLSLHNAVIYFVITLLIVKILTIYKAFIIFFKRNVVRLQIILYFCTLEIVPMLAFLGALELTANSLKINF